MSSQPGVAPSVHVVFSAECNHALTWQAVGLFHSHSAVGQPGNITRLLACSEEQLRTYRGMDVGPTFVHHNMRFGHPTLIDEAGYPSYNKPASVMFWLEQVRPTEEYIALLDTDMLLREPLDPIALGAAPGVVVSAEYSYLVGSEPQFARRFLDEHEVPLVVRCGGFHIFHREDIRRIAPLWIEFTRRVRAFAHAEPEAYFAESFLNWNRTDGLKAHELATRRNQGMWQAEMYGYIFGAARVGVSHVVRRDTMLYPGYPLFIGIPPSILHYGSDYELYMEPDGAARAAAGGDAKKVYFNKMVHKEVDLYEFVHSTGCRSDARDAPPGGAGGGESPVSVALSSGVKPFFFDDPPPPRHGDLVRSGRDLVAILNLQLLNSALCAFYDARCSEPVACRALHSIPTHGGRSGQRKHATWVGPPCESPTRVTHASHPCESAMRVSHASQPHISFGSGSLSISLALG